MKRLLPKNQASSGIPPRKYGKDGFIQDIQEYIGEDGYIPMEHAFRPSMNASAFDYDGMILAHPIGRGRTIRRIEYAEMDETMLAGVIRTLFQYQNWCRLYA